jgi:dTDP-4-amino-4,6-dideoxygalactose transaminase
VMPAFTFIATAHAFAWVGLEPVFCDISPETHSPTAADLDAAIGPACSALVAVHTWGTPCDVEAVEALARQRGLPLILDAAHAFACTYGSRPVGSAGIAEVFSFHATKFINSFEGGAITTNDSRLAERLRRLRDFGFAGVDNVISIGTNAKMSELHAAAGLTCLEALPAILDANRRCYQRYRDRLAGIPSLRMLDTEPRGQSNYQYVVVDVDPSAGVARDALVTALHAEKAYVRRYFYPGCHRSAPYAARSVQPHLPITDRVCSRVMVLPAGPLSETDIDTVVDTLALIFSRPDEFRERLAELSNPVST